MKHYIKRYGNDVELRLKHYIKSYGNDVELRLDFCEEANLVVKSEVLYNTGSYMKEHLSLGFIMGDKSVNSSTCFGGYDWKQLENIAHAQSEAFYAHGEAIDSLLIDDLIEISS